MSDSDLIAELQAQLLAATNFQQALESKNLWLKTHVNSLVNEIKSADPARKKVLGQLIQQRKLVAQTLFSEYQAQIKRQNFHQLAYDYSLVNQGVIRFHPHWLNHTINLACEWIRLMNFQLEIGHEVVFDHDNFDMLNIPKNHPSRTNSDTFFVSGHDINQKMILRTHNTVNSFLGMKLHPNQALRLATFGNVYRNDEDDATHSHQFSQIDLVWVDQHLSLAHLKWLVQSFLVHVFQRPLTFRYRPSFFPFTEPSFEVDVACVICEQQGCSVCKRTGWIEVLGAGLIHLQVFKNAQFTNPNYVGLALGVGCERLAMLKYQISDLRAFYHNDVRIFVKELTHAH